MIRAKYLDAIVTYDGGVWASPNAAVANIFNSLAAECTLAFTGYHPWPAIVIAECIVAKLGRYAEIIEQQQPPGEAGVVY